MIDELELVRQARPEVPVPEARAREAARRALDRAIAGPPGPSANRRWLGARGRVIPVLGVALAIGVVILFVSLSAQTPMTSTRSTPPAGPATPAKSTPDTAAPPPDQTVLTGTWTGHYSGHHNGTLTIIWQQWGWKKRSRGVFRSNLGGSMKLSSAPGTLSIHGTVFSNCPTQPCTIPDAIRFETVSGGPRIIYTGTVQHSPAGGAVLAGSYQTATGRGSWSVSQVGAP
jgi:hypothetical protein